MKKVIVYCANGYGERVAYSLDKDLYQVIAFADDKAEKWGQELYPGGGIIAPSEIQNLDYDFIMIALPQHADKIRKNLIERYSLDDKRILVYQPEIIGGNREIERGIMLRRCIALLKERSIPGNMAEVGVYRGDFARLMNAYLPEKKLYLFDTFDGFDARDSLNEGDDTKFKDTSVEYVLSRMTVPERCIVRKGYFPDTAAGLEDTFALVSLDCDLYEPILAGLEYFYPRMEKGGYIFVHDFGDLHFSGVKKAVYEYCEKSNMAFVPLTDTCRSIIITK